MRHILASVFLVVLLFPALALGGEVKYEDLVEREGLYYKKFTAVPFTGKITGNLQGALKNGKEEGLWVGYWDWKKGQIFYKGTFKDDKKDGPWVGYNEDGTVDEKWTGTYKDGVKVN